MIRSINVSTAGVEHILVFFEVIHSSPASTCIMGPAHSQIPHTSLPGGLSCSERLFHASGVANHVEGVALQEFCLHPAR